MNTLYDFIYHYLTYWNMQKGVWFPDEGKEAEHYRPIL